MRGLALCAGFRGCLLRKAVDFGGGYQVGEFVHFGSDRGSLSMIGSKGARAVLPGPHHVRHSKRRLPLNITSCLSVECRPAEAAISAAAGATSGIRQCLPPD